MPTTSDDIQAARRLREAFGTPPTTFGDRRASILWPARPQPKLEDRDIHQPSAVDEEHKPVDDGPDESKERLAD